MEKDRVNDTGKIPLSVAVITKNEAKRLSACLASVGGADQIVVVDAQSADETAAIARDLGCDVFEIPWRGFGPQKQFALDQCRNRWILLLDADERVPGETWAEIRRIVTDPSPGAAGYRFPRKNYFQGRWIRRAGFWPDAVTRLFLKDKGRMTETMIHEAVTVAGEVRGLACPLVHLTEDRLHPILAKINEYSTAGAAEAYARGRTSTIFGAFFRAVAAFLHGYLARGGFLDGREGFTLAVLDGINRFFKYAKLAELARAEDKREKG